MTALIKDSVEIAICEGVHNKVTASRCADSNEFLQSAKNFGILSNDCA